MRESKLKKAKFEIQKLFYRLKNRVFTPNEIKNIFNENKNIWRLSASTPFRRFVDFLLKEKIIQMAHLKFPYQKVIRFIKEDASIFEIAITLKKESYFTHYTSMYIHDLTEQIPKTIYLNCEQPLRNRIQKDLFQKNINLAFSRPWRVSNKIAEYDNYSICILNGMYTARLGVIHAEGPNGERIFITDLERTLIDIAVRPVYSGGIFEVLKAYRNAKDRINILKLVKYLKKLDYIYPYHQVIGFYLEKAGGYRLSQVDLLRDFGLKYDFYLTHQMKNMNYSKKWRLFFPEGF